MDAVSVATTSLPPLIDNGRISVRLEGAYFKQMRFVTTPLITPVMSID